MWYTYQTCTKLIDHDLLRHDMTVSISLDDLHWSQNDVNVFI